MSLQCCALVRPISPWYARTYTRKIAIAIMSRISQVYNVGRKPKTENRDRQSGEPFIIIFYWHHHCNEYLIMSYTIGELLSPENKTRTALLQIQNEMMPKGEIKILIDPSARNQFLIF